MECFRFFHNVIQVIKVCGNTEYSWKQLGKISSIINQQLHLNYFHIKHFKNT